MILLEKYSFETAVELLGFSKEQLYRYACEELISFAVPLYAFGGHQYKCLADGSIHEPRAFNNTAYLYTSTLQVNKEKILASGLIDTSWLFDVGIGFHKCPAGHHDYEYMHNSYQPYYSEHYRQIQFRDSSRQKRQSAIFLTREAVLCSPLTKNLFTQEVKEQKTNNRISSSILSSSQKNGRDRKTRPLLEACLKRYAEKKPSSPHPATPDQLMNVCAKEGVDGYVGLTLEGTGKCKKVVSPDIEGGYVNWRTFKNAFNEKMMLIELKRS